MKFSHRDGFTFEADTFRQAAEILWKSMFIPDDSIEAWMMNSAKRARIFNDSALRTDTVEHHVQDLIDTGFVALTDRK